MLVFFVVFVVKVLETIPWEQVDIRAISVETQHHSLVDRHKLFMLLEVDWAVELCRELEDGSLCTLLTWAL